MSGAGGLRLGLASIYARGLALHLAESPPGQQLLRHAVITPYAPRTLCANMAGFGLLLAAFHGGRASIVLGLSATLSNVVPILAAMLALGERLPVDNLVGDRSTAGPCADPGWCRPVAPLRSIIAETIRLRPRSVIPRPRFVEANAISVFFAGPQERGDLQLLPLPKVGRGQG